MRSIKNEKHIGEVTKMVEKDWILVKRSDFERANALLKALTEIIKHEIDA